MKILLNSSNTSNDELLRYIGKDVWVLVNIKAPVAHSFYIQPVSVDDLGMVTYRYVSLWFIDKIYHGHRFEQLNFLDIKTFTSTTHIDEIALYSPIEMLTNDEMERILTYTEKYDPPTQGDLYL